MLNFPRLATGQQKGEGQSWQIMRAGYGTQVRSADSETFESDGGGGGVFQLAAAKERRWGIMGLGRRRERESPIQIPMRGGSCLFYIISSVEKMQSVRDRQDFTFISCEQCWVYSHAQNRKDQLTSCIANN